MRIQPLSILFFLPFFITGITLQETTMLFIFIYTRSWWSLCAALENICITQYKAVWNLLPPGVDTCYCVIFNVMQKPWADLMLPLSYGYQFKYHHTSIKILPVHKRTSLSSGDPRLHFRRQRCFQEIRVAYLRFITSTITSQVIVIKIKLRAQK